MADHKRARRADEVPSNSAFLNGPCGTGGRQRAAGCRRHRLISFGGSGACYLWSSHTPFTNLFGGGQFGCAAGSHFPFMSLLGGTQSSVLTYSHTPLTCFFGGRQACCAADSH